MRERGREIEVTRENIAFERGRDCGNFDVFFTVFHM